MLSNTLPTEMDETILLRWLNSRMNHQGKSQIGHNTDFVKHMNAQNNKHILEARVSSLEVRVGKPVWQ